MKALLLFDPDRRDEQLAFVAERATILHEIGDGVWVSMPEEHLDRFAAQGIEVQPHADADLVVLPAVTFDPAIQVPEPPPGLAADPVPGEPTYHLVQFVVAPLLEWIAAIEDLGGAFVENAPVNVGVFRMTSAQAEQARGLTDVVSWVGPWHPAYAVSFVLAGRVQPFTAADLHTLRLDPQQLAGGSDRVLSVAFFADRPADQSRAAVVSAGAEIVGDRGFDLVIDLGTGTAAQLLRVPGVRLLAVRRKPQPTNQRAGLILGANQVRNFGNVDFLVNLDGTGEIVGVFDTGLDNGAVPTTHTDFDVVGAPGTSRVVRIDNLNVAPVTSADIDGHGTHVAGSIIGSGVNAPGPTGVSPTNSVPFGVAPAARILLTSVNDFPPPPPPPPVPLPMDFSRYIQAFQNHYAAGARVHCNSWGGGPPLVGGVPVPTYDIDAEQIDRFAYLNPDAVVLFAAGNEEADADNDGRLDQLSLGPEATTKNTLVIGASENVTSLDGDGRNYQTRTSPCARYGTLGASAVQVAANAPAAFTASDSADDIALFSNRGRIGARVKPDLVAPGTNILSTRSSVMAVPATVGQVCPPIANPPGIPNPRIARTAPAARYFVISGTSMATPLVAGACLLVRQFYRQRFGQLRRPLLLEALPAPVDLPAAVEHPTGCVLAWIRRDVGAARNDLVAARFSRALVRATPIVTVAAGVGDHPAMALARHGATTLVLHRDGANVLHLAKRTAALAPVAGFAGGGVALAPASRPEDDRRPTIAVHGDEVAVAWWAAGTQDLLFQRFQAADGSALDAAATVLGTGTHTGPHPFVAHDGTSWAVFWGATDAGNFQLRVRFVAATGVPDGAQPTTLLSQAASLREPHAVWDPRQGRFLVAFTSEGAAPARGIRTLRVNPDGTVFGAPSTAVALAAPAAGRRPRLGLHPDRGFVLVWEDNAQVGGFDVAFGFLDDAGAPAAPSLVRISDTPRDTAGFSALVDADGLVPLWQSEDEVNADVRGAFALRVRPNGVFAAQVDPATPLLVEQFYLPQTLVEHADPALVPVAMAWAGGDFLLLRQVPRGASARLDLVRADADGTLDTAVAAAGAIAVVTGIRYRSLALAWTGRQAVLATTSGLETAVRLYDSRRLPVAAFGAGGVQRVPEPPAPGISVQVAQSGTGAAFRIFLCYGRQPVGGAASIRYTVRNAAGGAVVAPRDLAPADGTARHGWFHHVGTDAPVHVIAAWHAQVGANSQAQLNRFQLNGAPQAAPPGPLVLTALPGDAQNPVLAPRPLDAAPAVPVVGVAAFQRVFGAAWQQRAPGGNWQIMFSRLGRDGRPSIVAGEFDVPVAAGVTHHHTEPQLVWHTDGYGLGWLQQPVGGGPHQLFFQVLDENGRPPDLAVTPPAAPALPFALSAAAADVQQFQLVWNGRTFRVTWVEVEGGRARHRQRGIAVPRQASGARYDAPFQQPSSALIRATLINGATNIRNTNLPNVGNAVNDGYGWGRVNLRQSLAPALPVTFHVRDDAAVGAARSVRYRFELPPGTQLLRVALAWTDPPSTAPATGLVNNLGLRVTTPAFPGVGVRVFHGNRWQTAAGRTHLSAPVIGPPPPFENVHNVKQVVVAGPMPAGAYQVDVICTRLNPAGAFQQFPSQPFALVLVGSGGELRTAAGAVATPLPFF